MRQQPALSAAQVARVAVRLSVVLPVYNEQEILTETVSAVVAAVGAPGGPGPFEVLICDNGSTDRTRVLARELAAADPRVRVLEFPLPDYGAALRAGFHAATGDRIVNFDADYYDFDFLERALRVDADIVVAAKGIAGSDDARVLLRRVVSRSFSLFVRHLLDVRTTETHGMKVFRRSAIAPLLREVQSTKDLFDTELVARAERRGLSIVELPIRTVEMRHSRSGILMRIPRTVWGLLQLRHRLAWQDADAAPLAALTGAELGQTRSASAIQVPRQPVGGPDAAQEVDTACATGCGAATAAG